MDEAHLIVDPFCKICTPRWLINTGNMNFVNLQYEDIKSLIILIGNMWRPAGLAQRTGPVKSRGLYQ